MTLYTHAPREMIVERPYPPFLPLQARGNGERVSQPLFSPQDTKTGVTS